MDRPKSGIVDCDILIVGRGKFGCATAVWRPHAVASGGGGGRGDHRMMLREPGTLPTPGWRSPPGRRPPEALRRRTKAVEKHSRTVFGRRVA